MGEGVNSKALGEFGGVVMEGLCILVVLVVT